MPSSTSSISPPAASRSAPIPPKAAAPTTLPPCSSSTSGDTSKRTRSSRGLETACSENLQAIWLTSNLRPDHSTIADFRKDHPVPFKSMLREFNLICFELRLFGKELVAIDGTFIKAVNSTTRSFAKIKIDKLIEGMVLEATNSAPELRWPPEVARIDHSESIREKSSKKAHQIE